MSARETVFSKTTSMRLILSALTASVVLSLALTLPLGNKGKISKLLPEAYVAIPGGSVVIDGVESHIEEFYISRREVSNLDYAEFLWYLNNEDADEQKIRRASVKSENWLIQGTDLEPIAKTYHQHPAYHEYPVVNISYDAAVMYCDWLEAILGERFGGEYDVKVMLPSRQQWVRAARGSDLNAKYAWGGQYLRDSKGQLLCNFRKIGAESVHFNAESDSYEIAGQDSAQSSQFTSPSESFGKNEFGLFNMNGNVTEMIRDEGVAVGGSWNDTGYDVRVESAVAYEQPSPTVGFRPVLHIEKVK